MDEPTTTDVVTQDSGAEIAQPVEQQTEAVQTTDLEQPTNDQSSDSTEAPTDDVSQEQDVWAKKGIDISTAEGQAKAAKMYADAQKALTQKAQKASELEKQLSAPTDEYDNDRVARLEVIMKTRDFFDSNPEAKELEAEMAAYINSDPTGTKRELVKAGYLSLEEVHAIVSANPNRTTELKAEGRKEGLQELANKQRATAVNGSAVNKAPAPSLSRANAESWWESLGAEGRADPANRQKLDSLLS